MFVFLLPYVCACLWGHAGEQTKEALEAGRQRRETQAATAYWVDISMEWGVWELPAEEYLVYRLEQVMPQEYEEEAMKAQAVLLRTELVRAYQAQGSDRIEVEDAALALRYYEDNAQESDRYEAAVQDTRGLYLAYLGEPVLAAYFKVSNGKTRDAQAVWNTEAYPYLAGVNCEQDRGSAEWSSTKTVDRESYVEGVRSLVGETYTEESILSGAQLLYDEAGYVTQVVYTQAGEETSIDGETFRYLWGLQSASFEMEQTQEQIVFHVTGVGHGFGMSQYGANCKALNGADYKQILQDFFPQTELAKFE